MIGSTAIVKSRVQTKELHNFTTKYESGGFHFIFMSLMKIIHFYLKVLQHIIVIIVVNAIIITFYCYCYNNYYYHVFHFI